MNEQPSVITPEQVEANMRFGQVLQETAQKHAAGLEESYVDAARQGDEAEHPLNTEAVTKSRQEIEPYKQLASESAEQISKREDMLNSGLLQKGEAKTTKDEIADLKIVKKSLNKQARRKASDFRDTLSREATQQTDDALDTYQYWGGSELPASPALPKREAGATLSKEDIKPDIPEITRPVRASHARRQMARGVPSAAAVDEPKGWPTAAEQPEDTTVAETLPVSPAVEPSTAAPFDYEVDDPALSTDLDPASAPESLPQNWDDANQAVRAANDELVHAQDGGDPWEISRAVQNIRAAVARAEDIRAGLTPAEIEAAEIDPPVLWDDEDASLPEVNTETGEVADNPKAPRFLSRRWLRHKRIAASAAVANQLGRFNPSGVVSARLASTNAGEHALKYYDGTEKGRRHVLAAGIVGATALVSSGVDLVSTSYESYRNAAL
jgi:hypothetical protein